MSDPLQAPAAAEKYPYASLESWRGPEKKFKDGDVIDHIEQRGDPYIASHVWTYSNHGVETFGESVTGDAAQDRLREFLLRDMGVWTESPETRKARWIEIVGDIGLEGEHPTWVETLCGYMKLQTTVLDRPGVSISPRPPSSAQWTRAYRADVVDHGHLTHVAYDSFGHMNHMFLLQNNAIITIYGSSNIFDPLRLPLLLHGTPPRPPSEGQVNAAAIMWRVLTLHVEDLADTEEWKQKYIASRQYQLHTGDRTAAAHLRSHLNEQVVIPLQLLEGISQRLLDQTATSGEGSRWMEADMKAEFTRLVQYCQEVLRKDADWLCQHELGVDFVQDLQAGEANRIAEQSAQSAAKQAHSAVVLNRLLATFTAVTVICVPFTMTAAFFSMNTLEDVPLTIHTFWIIVGSATGAITAAGILLGLLFRFWRDVAGDFIKSPDSNQDKTLEQILGISEPTTAVNPVTPKWDQWTSNAVKSIRHRFPTIGGCVKGDEETRAEHGASSGHDMETRAA